MHLEDGTRSHFMSMLSREFPEMVAKYEQLYASKYVPKDYDKRVQEVVGLMRRILSRRICKTTAACFGVSASPYLITSRKIRRYYR